MEGREARCSERAVDMIALPFSSTLTLTVPNRKELPL